MAAAGLVWVDERLAVVNKPAGISLATRRNEPGAAAARLVAALEPAEAEAWGLAGSSCRSAA